MNKEWILKEWNRDNLRATISNGSFSAVVEVPMEVSKDETKFIEFLSHYCDLLNEEIKEQFDGIDYKIIQ